MYQYNHARAYVALMTVTDEVVDITNGIAEFSVGRLPGGMYIGRLIFDNTVIATEKITVVR